jgi:RNA polymerase I specific transcription initiation factor RRN3
MVEASQAAPSALRINSVPIPSRSRTSSPLTASLKGSDAPKVQFTLPLKVSQENSTSKQNRMHSRAPFSGIPLQQTKSLENQSKFLHSKNFEMHTKSEVTSSSTFASEFPPFECGPRIEKLLDDAFREMEESENAHKLEYFYEAFDVMNRSKSGASYNGQTNNFFTLDEEYLSTLEWLLWKLNEQFISKMVPSKFMTLAKKLFQIEWTIVRETFVQIYQQVIVNLISAQPGFLSLCLENLMKIFLTKNALAVSEESYKMNFHAAFSAIISISDERESYERVHRLFKSLIGIVPRLDKAVGPLIFVPYIKSPLEEQSRYIANLLYMASYYPYARPSIFQHLLNHVLKIDVELQVMIEEMAEEDIDALLENETAATDRLLSKSFEEECCIVDPDSESEADDEPMKKVGGQLGEKETYAKKLLLLMDSLLAQILVFIREFYTLSLVDSYTHRQWRLFYRELLGLFEDLLLPTIKSKVTQYVLFYAASLEAGRPLSTVLAVKETEQGPLDEGEQDGVAQRGGEFHDLFLGLLLEKLFQSQEEVVGRKRKERHHKYSQPGRSQHKKRLFEFDMMKWLAISYIGSYLARAKTIQRTSLVYSLHLLFTWCENYMVTLSSANHTFYYPHHQEGVLAPGANHILFYGVCQAIFYIFCFRHEDILVSLGSSGNSGEVGKSHPIGSAASSRFRALFEKLCFSPLQPLRHTTPSIAEEFVRLCRHYYPNSALTALNLKRPLTTFKQSSSAAAAMASLSCPASRSLSPLLPNSTSTSLLSPVSSSSSLHHLRSASTISLYSSPAPDAAALPLQRSASFAAMPLHSTTNFPSKSPLTCPSLFSSSSLVLGAAPSSLTNATFLPSHTLWMSVADLEPFFPFDPIPFLKKSSALLPDAFYKPWHAQSDEESNEDLESVGESYDESDGDLDDQSDGNRDWTLSEQSDAAP